MASTTRFLTPAVLAAFVSIATRAAAQAGTLPVLAALPAKSGICHAIPNTPASQKMGIVRTAMFDLAVPDRSVSVSVNAAGKPVFVTARAGRAFSVQKGETENVIVFYQPDGTIRSGERRYHTTSTTTNARDEKKTPLLKADTAQVKALAAAVIARCMR